MACIHCPKDWNKTKLELVKKSEGRCSLCSSNGPKLWACLQNDCEFIGCPEAAEDHSSKHYQETNHGVAVNLLSFRCWCNICNKEVHLPDFFTALEMKNIKARLKKATDAAKENNASIEDIPPLESSPHLVTSAKCSSLSSLQFLLQGSGFPEVDSTRGLTGLRNLGNTCYMNSALQSLSNCPQLTLHFLALGKFYNMEKKSMMAQSYYRLVCDMWSSRYASVSPTAVSNSVKMVNPMFRGHQQQDTQELLRCLMDRLHEETKFSIPASNSPASKQEAGDADVRNIISHPPGSSEQPGEDAVSMTVSTSSDDSFRSCDSLNATKPGVSDETQPMLTDSDFPKELDELHSSGSPLFRSNSFPSLVKTTHQHIVESITDSVRRRTMSSHSTPVSEDSAVINRVKTSKVNKEQKEQHSVISDIFDGALWSSVQCKTCNSVWHTRETFQDLSLPIPGKDDTARLHGLNPTQLPLPVPNTASGPCANTESYSYRLYEIWEWFKSWFFGPQVTLTDCLSAFFSADDLKGDNMYSCEKCKKLRNGVKYCRLLRLPEVLCIHLKRFRYEYLTSYSTKISSAVTFPLNKLDLSRYVASDCVSQVKTYDLSSVIVHQGGAGGGHYTSYCMNPLNGKWYEFDDQYVTEVPESVVAGAEAYVLFYSKKSDESSMFREEVLKIADSLHQSILMRFFISVQWMVRFLTHAEPGPINNHYLLCRHGNVKPSIASNAEVRVCCVPEQVWRALYQRYGGGPVVTRMQACETCVVENKKIQEKREEEKKIYLQLSQGHEEDYSQQTYFISMGWYRKWQGFIQGDRDPPDEIDNNAIALIVDGKINVKKDSDFGELTAEAWKYLHKLYGGGPTIPRAPVDCSRMEVD